MKGIAYSRMLAGEPFSFNCEKEGSCRILYFYPPEDVALCGKEISNRFCQDYIRNFFKVSSMINESTKTEGINPLEECRKNLREWFAIEEFSQCVEDYYGGNCVYCGSMNSILFLYVRQNVLFLSSEGKKRLEEGDDRPLETLSFYSLISRKTEPIHILHAAAVLNKKEKKVLLFTGESGAGKSTVCEKVKKEGEILADELAVLRIHDNVMETCGSRWSTKKEFACGGNDWYPVDRIYFLHKNMPYRIKKMAQGESLLPFMNQLYPYAYLHISSFDHIKFDFLFAKRAVSSGICYLLESELNSGLRGLFQ